MTERIVSVGGNKATRPLSDVRGVGVSAAYPKTSTGVNILSKGTVITKKAIIVAKVTEVFADGTGTQPTFKIGEVGSDASFAATTIFTNAANGTTFTFAGELAALKNLIVTATAATGDGTGALAITALILPKQ